MAWETEGAGENKLRQEEVGFPICFRVTHCLPALSGLTQSCAGCTCMTSLFSCASRAGEKGPKCVQNWGAHSFAVHLGCFSSCFLCLLSLPSVEICLTPRSITRKSCCAHGLPGHDGGPRLTFKDSSAEVWYGQQRRSEAELRCFAFFFFISFFHDLHMNGKSTDS